MLLGWVARRLVMPLLPQTKLLTVFVKTDYPCQMASRALSLWPGVLRTGFLRPAVAGLG